MGRGRKQKILDYEIETFDFIECTEITQGRKQKILDYEIETKDTWCVRQHGFS